jgi:hypothetical protein
MFCYLIPVDLYLFINGPLPLGRCPSTVSSRALVSFRSRHAHFFASSRKSAALRGGGRVFVYAVQAFPAMEAEIGVQKAIHNNSVLIHRPSFCLTILVNSL